MALRTGRGTYRPTVGHTLRQYSGLQQHGTVTSKGWRTVITTAAHLYGHAPGGQRRHLLANAQERRDLVDGLVLAEGAIHIKAHRLGAAPGGQHLGGGLGAADYGQ